MLPVVLNEKPPIYVRRLVNKALVNDDLKITAPDLVQTYSIETTCVLRCPNCKGLVLSINQKPVWPIHSGIQPAQYMPDNIRKPFEEAQLIAAASPWSACALLRICLERLVEHLGGTGKNLYERIESLGLAADEKPLWDAIRKIGNDAAHEGLFPFDEKINLDVANVISGFVNLLVERHIGAPENAVHLLEVLKAAQDKTKS